jgi:TatD DNase family protein
MPLMRFFEVLETLQGPYKGIFHCFTGSYQQAERAIDFGLKLGIGGVVTFKNGKIDQFLKEIPLEHIVLETDAPYLAPVPYRGKRNNPEYLKLIAQKLALLYEVPLEEIARITSENSKKLFKL